MNDVVTGDKQNKKASQIIKDIPEEVFMSLATHFQAYGGFIRPIIVPSILHLWSNLRYLVV